MKKQLRFFSLICVAVALFGCAKEETSGLVASSDGDLLANSKPIGYVMSMGEIRSLALSAPKNYLLPRATTKSSVKRIKEIVSLSDLDGVAPIRTCTAGDVSGTNAFVNNIYVVNYDNDEGYVIISADNRLPEILAFSDDGNIPHDLDEIKVLGVIAFLKALPEYAEEEIARATTLQDDYNPYPDSLPDRDGYYRLNFRTEYTPWSYVEHGPILNTQWGQGYPYNVLTPICTSGYHSPTGCVATAVAQIMAYHCYPTTIYSDGLGRDVTFDWESILSRAKLNDSRVSEEDQEAVAALMAVIGKNVDMNYDCLSSGAYSENVPEALYTMGYTCDNYNASKPSNSLQDYDTKAVCLEADSYPVYVSGHDLDANVGHAWVIDGYGDCTRQYVTVWDLFDINMNYVRTEYRVEYGEHHYYNVHCNWGWDGEYDGFFESEVFDIREFFYKQS